MQIARLIQVKSARGPQVTNKIRENQKGHTCSSIFIWLILKPKVLKVEVYNTNNQFVLINYFARFHPSKNESALHMISIENSIVAIDWSEWIISLVNFNFFIS